MGLNLTRKILGDHLVSGALVAGREIAIRIDQTLTQDATGTMAYLQFEAIGLDRVKTEVSVSYVDHNMLQDDFKNADDHRYLQSVAARYGIWFSRPGNGICHQVHRERFGVPGKTLLGSDSHTPTCGGLGMIAIGAGGLDVAVAMGGGPFYTPMPEVLGIELIGSLQPGASGKDIILEVLRRLTCAGGTGRVMEYYGPGVANLPVSERFTVANMGAELGATTSIFPSDDRTRRYLRAQGREKDWRPLAPDADAAYDRITLTLHRDRDARAIAALREPGNAVNLRIGEPDAHGFVAVSFDGLVIDLDRLEPLLAAPHFPDNVYKVTELDRDGPVTVEIRDTKGTTTRTFEGGVPVQQVCIGSCTNSSFHDLVTAAHLLKGKTVHPAVSMTLTPGSKQVFENIARCGALADIIASGARILESACGPCIGMGQAPPSGSVSVRSFNRNFEGRSGTGDALVFLASPETCVATALAGRITDPRTIMAGLPRLDDPEQFLVNDGMLLPPPAPAEAKKVEILRGPNIRPLPEFDPFPQDLRGQVELKAGDNVSTDHIMPAGARVLPLRSNIPEIAKFVFERLDPGFAARAAAARDAPRGPEVGWHVVIVGGANYGQGSSREHAALAPRYLGVRVVLAKSFARIHRENLINFGILPLTFVDPKDWDRLGRGMKFHIEKVREKLKRGDSLEATVLTEDGKFVFKCACLHGLTPRQIDLVEAGGLLNHVKFRHRGRGGDPGVSAA